MSFGFIYVLKKLVGKVTLQAGMLGVTPAVRDSSQNVFEDGWPGNCIDIIASVVLDAI
jgi:hypothetical protein